jgi:hypothetical protein
MKTIYTKFDVMDVVFFRHENYVFKAEIKKINIVVSIENSTTKALNVGYYFMINQNEKLKETLIGNHHAIWKDESECYATIDDLITDFDYIDETASSEKSKTKKKKKQ